MTALRKLCLLLVSLTLLSPAVALTSSAQASSWVPKATPKQAAYNAQKIANSPKRCYYYNKSTRFVANSYRRTSTGFSTADGYRKFLASKKKFFTGGSPSAGRPVFYTTSGGGLVGISTGTGYVWAPDPRGCIQRYPLRSVPGTWYHGWGYAAMKPSAPYWP